MADQFSYKPAEDPLRSSDEIRDDITARREQISQTVGQLGERMQEPLDWKGYVVRHPYASVGIAVGAGFVLSRLFRKKASPSERIVDALVDKVEDLGDDLRDSVRRMVVKAAAPSVFRGALYGLAGRALLHYMQTRLMHVEGNGHQQASDTLWEDARRTPSTPPVMS